MSCTFLTYPEGREGKVATKNFREAKKPTQEVTRRHPRRKKMIEKEAQEDRRTEAKKATQVVEGGG